MVHGVISKGFYNCSKDEIEAAYKEFFGFAPCPTGTCKSLDYKKVFNVLEKQYNKKYKVERNQSKQKYIWNPIHSGLVVFYKGIPVTDRETNQDILETLYNQPMKKGLIILNPDYEGA